MRYVRAYHLIITAYGFWLPNDPRGSWSEWVRAWELLKFGPATKTTERRSVARTKHDIQQRLAAKGALVRPAVKFTGEQAKAIAEGFRDYLLNSGCVMHACAILPEHVHAVVARHTCSIEQVSNLLKGAATTALKDAGLHPFVGRPYRNGKLPTPWARKCWSRFLSTDEDIWRSIRYVEDNPRKEGKAAQYWRFVMPFVS